MRSLRERDAAAAAAHPDGESELLRKELPPSVARGLAEFCILLFLAALAFVLFVKLPVTVTGRFTLHADGGSDPVTAPVGGIVEEVRVAVGSDVEAGTTLVVLRSDEVRRLAAERLQLAEDLADARRRVSGLEGAGAPGEAQARVQRLEAEHAAALALAEESEARHQALVQAAEADVAQAAGVVRSRRARVGSLDALAAQHDALAEEGVVSQRDRLLQRERLEDARAEMDEARREHAVAQAEQARIVGERLVERAQQAGAIARLEGELAEARAALEEDALRARALVAGGEERLAALDRALVGAADDRLAVRAPHDGTVVSLAHDTEGAVVERGVEIARVARRGARLHARIDIPEDEAASVAPGQPVRLMLDAFPYTRHGVVPATLTWVSPASVDAMVPATAELERDWVAVDGVRRTLPLGAAGRARIDTGRSTVLRYMLEPLARVRHELGGKPPEPEVKEQPDGPR